ncbi:MAG: hypothetical protein HEEMFOPI_00178 [Holosporales bacterium]
MRLKSLYILMGLLNLKICLGTNSPGREDPFVLDGPSCEMPLISIEPEQLGIDFPEPRGRTQRLRESTDLREIELHQTNGIKAEPLKPERPIFVPSARRSQSDTPYQTEVTEVTLPGSPHVRYRVRMVPKSKPNDPLSRENFGSVLPSDLRSIPPLRKTANPVDSVGRGKLLGNNNGGAIPQLPKDTKNQRRAN